MTFNEYNEPQDEDPGPTQDDIETSYTREEQRVTQDTLRLPMIFDSSNVSIDIAMVNEGRAAFHGNFQSRINRLFNMMSAISMAIACSQNREGFLLALEEELTECESYYSDHIQLFSNIISMGRELLNSERQNGWVDTW